MGLLETLIRRSVTVLGVGNRWLREHLSSMGVRVPLSAGCLEELIRDADAAAWRLRSPGRLTYLRRFREQLAERAQFVYRWTVTDESIESGDAARQRLVRIARNFALPRPWKVSEPVVCERGYPQHSYWRWSAGVGADPPCNSLEKIACGDFFETLHGCRRQKA